MVRFNSVQNSEKWLDFSVENNQKTLLFATREFLILFYTQAKARSLICGFPEFTVPTFRDGGC